MKDFITGDMAFSTQPLTKVDKLDIIRAYANEVLTVWFVGSFKAYRSGSAPRYRSAAHYRNQGVFTEDATGRLQCEGMEFSRHHSKVSAIMDQQGVLLHGQYCKHCRTPMPAKWGNCYICTRTLVRVTPETKTLLAARMARLVSASPVQEVSAAQELVKATPTVAPQAVAPAANDARNSGVERSPLAALNEIASKEAHLRAILESDDPDKATLLASLLEEVIGAARKPFSLPFDAAPEKAHLSSPVFTVEDRNFSTVIYENGHLFLQVNKGNFKGVPRNVERVVEAMKRAA